MKVVTIVGARPQFIKAAPLCRALKAANIQEILLDTGQHYDESMAGSFFKELKLPAPSYSLNIGSASHGKMTGRMLEKIEQVLLTEKPNGVIVYGDTNSTLAGALAAAKLDIPILHIEAGLRSYRRAMPEEINRCLTDHMSKFLLCPTNTAVENLISEGISSPDITSDMLSINDIEKISPFNSTFVMNVGDIMTDALLSAKNNFSDETFLKEVEDKKFVLVTMHRAESTDDATIFRGLIESIADLSRQIPVIFPLHPRTKNKMNNLGLFSIFENTRTQFLPPLSYGQFVRAQSLAKVIVTDSGGVQKEACILGTPCLTLREETEWVETVTSGWNKLLGTAPKNLYEEVQNACAPKTKGDMLFGDGQTALRIATLIKSLL